MYKIKKSAQSEEFQGCRSSLRFERIEVEDRVSLLRLIILTLSIARRLWVLDDRGVQKEGESRTISISPPAWISLSYRNDLLLFVFPAVEGATVGETYGCLVTPPVVLETRVCGSVERGRRFNTLPRSRSGLHSYLRCIWIPIMPDVDRER